MVKFGERLKELRTERNLSRKTLSEKLKVSTRLISYWECGERECDFSALIKLADLFEVSIDYLIGYKDY